jgi:hypothetical protein
MTPWGVEGAGPWSPAAGSPIFDGSDPRDLAGTVSFFAYSVASDDLPITIYAESDLEDPALYLAEEEDALTVVLVNRPAPQAVGGHQGSGTDGPAVGIVARLQRPLSERLVLDGTGDLPASRVESGPMSSALAAMREASIEDAQDEAVEIHAWSVSENGAVISVYWPCRLGKASVSAIETDTAVLLLLTDQIKNRQPDVHYGYALAVVGDAPEVAVELQRPLGDRLVIDATSGVAPPRVSTRPNQDPGSQTPLPLTLSARDSIRRTRTTYRHGPT